MKYMGSKNRHAKELLPIILKDRKPEQWYVEPFVGGANMIDKVDGNRIGADFHPHLIKALEMVRDNPELIPRNNNEYTKERYELAKTGDLNNPVDCLAMFQYSFASMFKGAWAKNSRGTDYVKECVRNLLIQSDRLKGCILLHSDYKNLNIPKNSIIYCDPPYEGTAKYSTGAFNHDAFWQWCREKAAEGHQIYISEYNAPNDFVCVWEKLTNVGFSKERKTASDRIEKLFIYRGQPK